LRIQGERGKAFVAYRQQLTAETESYAYKKCAAQISPQFFRLLFNCTGSGQPEERSAGIAAAVSAAVLAADECDGSWTLQRTVNLTNARWSSR
jgi:hypothetical protein